MRSKKYFLIIIGLLFFSMGTDFLPDMKGMVINDIPLETRRAIRQEMLSNLIVKYESNQVFPKVYEYMEMKYQELHKTTKPRSPEIVIKETFDKARLMFEKTKPFVKNSFKHVYDPVQIENNVNKYLWLKGLCFLVLGICDEHRVALAYFYLPGNEALKQDFLKDVVMYSFPDVPDLPENQAWQAEMTSVMDRLGYKIFNIDRILNQNNNDTNN